MLRIHPYTSPDMVPGGLDYLLNSHRNKTKSSPFETLVTDLDSGGEVLFSGHTPKCREKVSY